MPLPDWMTDEHTMVPPVGRHRRSWITTAVNKLAHLQFYQRNSHNRSVSIDPRTAFVAFVALMICATFLRSFGSLLACWIVGFTFSYIVGAKFRTLVVGCVVSGTLTVILMLPSAVVGSLGAANITVVTIRMLACLTLGIGLFSSNKAEDLFSSLGWFRVPSVFIMVLLMTHRYIFVLIQSAHEAHVARKSRVFDETSLSASRKWLGEQIGALFARSQDLGEEIHKAMISRGFDREWNPSQRRRFCIMDFAWITGSISLSIILITFDKGLFH